MTRKYWIALVFGILILGTAAAVLKKESAPLPQGENSTSTEVVPGTKQVVVFFGNSKLDPDATCVAVFSVKRQVADTPAIGRAALESLLQGPTEAEKSEGYFSSLNQGIKINNLSIRDGIATVDFDGKMQEGVGGSCRVSAIRSQVTETLKQFATVNTVLISVDGRTEDVLQP